MRARTVLLPVILSACSSSLCQDPNVRASLEGQSRRAQTASTQPDPRAWHPSTYTAPRIATPPVIDGRIDDPIWQTIPWTPPFWSSMGFVKPRHETRAKLAWDDQNLYVAFAAVDDDIVSKNQQGEPFVHDDDQLYTSEVVEIFLDADNDGRTYDEIEISPLDKIFDSSFTGRRQGMNIAWSSGTRHAVQVRGTVNDSSDTDQGWTAELAIPFAQLTAVPHVPPQVGEHWTFNLFRLDHGRGVGEEGQAFSPVMIGDFHNLPRYGTLVFGGPP